jgi:hypothetical protein
VSHKLLTGAAALVVMAFGSGEAHAQLVRKDDKLGAFVVHRCPSESETVLPVPPAALPGVSDLLGLGIDYVFDKLGDALAKAAEVDKNGRATSATVPGYLYRIRTASADGKPGKFEGPGCIVVALADSDVNKWCNLAPLQGTEPCVGTSQLSTLIAPILGLAPHVGTSPPSFYAEILLIPSNDSAGFLPKLMTLYYPAGLHDSGKFTNRKKARDLSISASAATPSGQGALSSVNVILKDLLPSPTLVVRNVQRDVNGVLRAIDPNPMLDKATLSVWHAVASPPEKAVGNVGSGVVPVNIAVEVREVGDPNKFLQVLAAAFAKNKDTLAGDAKAKLIPSVAAAAAAAQTQTSLAADAEYNIALGAVFAAEAALRAACAVPTNAAPDNGKLEVRQAWMQLSAAEANVLKIESLQSRKPSGFGFDAYHTAFEADKTARVNCQKITP